LLVYKQTCTFPILNILSPYCFLTCLPYILQTVVVVHWLQFSNIMPGIYIIGTQKKNKILLKEWVLCSVSMSSPQIYSLLGKVIFRIIYCLNELLKDVCSFH
jgi:hypothetical protein